MKNDFGKSDIEIPISRVKENRLDQHFLRVAFEVQLSNQDWNHMRERQERYKAYGVRGLWFVTSKKGFPATEELPLFFLENRDKADWVFMASRWDKPYLRWEPSGAGRIQLRDFIAAALNHKLKFSPFWPSRPKSWEQADTVLQVEVHAQECGTCAHCRLNLFRPYSVTARIADNDTFPSFWWHHSLRPGTTHWFLPLVMGVSKSIPESQHIGFMNKNWECSSCSRGLEKYKNTPSSKIFSGQVRLGLLPEPRAFSFEYNWLRSWALT